MQWSVLLRRGQKPDAVSAIAEICDCALEDLRRILKGPPSARSLQARSTLGFLGCRSLQEPETHFDATSEHCGPIAKNTATARRMKQGKPNEPEMWISLLLSYSRTGDGPLKCV